MPGYVVVDASLAVKWLLTEDHTGEAVALVHHWDAEQVQMAGVHLLPMEVANALHKHVIAGDITFLDANALMSRFLTIGVQLIYRARLHARALEIASELRQGAVYDSYYLALAEALDCDMWTADSRFQCIAADARYPVHWVGDFAAN